MTQQLDALLDELIEHKNIYSAFMSVVSGDGTFQWSGARGVLSPGGPPVTPTTPWFVASITKLFIASVVMRLVEQGELALADPLVDRLPDALTHRLHVLDGKDRTDQITIAHLLHHASGLPDFIEDYPKKQRKVLADRRSLVEMLVEDGDRDWSLEDTAQWVRERLTPHFVPQALDGKRVRIRYSDTNYQLLVGIVETCRKAPFPRILQDLILDPLELKNTWFSGHFQGAGPEPAVPVLYAGTDPINIPRFLTSIGDMNATCDDLISFFRAVVQGRLFEKDDTWRRMQSPAYRFSFPTDRGALRQPGWPIEYGLGVMGFRLPRLFTPFRPMPRVVGHTGSTGTWLFYAPELDMYLAGAVSQITAGPVPFRVVPKILRMLSDQRR